MISLDKYIDDEGYSPIPCPNCGSKVAITNSRDYRILSTYANCQSCDGSYFDIDSEAFVSLSYKDLVQTDSEIVAIKYFYWASKPDAKLGYRCNQEWD